jgi:hypothetical protein
MGECMRVTMAESAIYAVVIDPDKHGIRRTVIEH